MGAWGPPGIRRFAYATFTCAALAGASPIGANADTGTPDFDVTAFDPRFHDDPAAWLGDFGLFGLPGALAQPFSTGVVGLDRRDDPRDMASGVKVSGRAGEWTIDLLGVSRPDAADGASSDAVVARMTRNLFAGLRLGLVMTEGAPQHDLDARTMGVDLRYRAENALEGLVWLQQTNNDWLNEDHGTLDDEAWGLALRYPGGRNAMEAWYQHYGEDFDPALGTVNRAGVDDTRFHYRLNRPAEGASWRMTHGLEFRDIHALANGEASRTVQWSPLEIRHDDGDGLRLLAGSHRETLVNGFQLVNHLAVAPGEYRYDRYGLAYDTDRFDGLVFGARFMTGDYLAGHREDWRLNGAWQASEGLRLEADYIVEAHEQPTGEFTARTLALRSTLALAAGWSFAPLVQLNNISDQLGMKARLHWQAGEGRDVLLVWNRTVLRNLEDRFVDPVQESLVKGMYRIRF